MNRSTIIVSLFSLVLLLSVVTASAQEPDLERGNMMLQEAIALINDGSYEEAWTLLERGRKEFPRHSAFRYEQGYILMAQEEYGKAAEVFSEILDAPDATGQYYAMLGNAYDLDGKPKKAVEMYEAGIRKFPESGPLYLELGVIQATEGEYEQAVATWEKGLTVAPTHPSNFYHAARMYMQTPIRGWGIIYAEIFLNLEPSTQRSEEMRALLWNAYNDAIILEEGVGEDGERTITNGAEFFADAFAIEAVTDSTVRVGFPFYYEIATMSPIITLSLSLMDDSDGDDKDTPAFQVLRADGKLTLEALHEYRLMFLKSWEMGRGAEFYNVELFAYQRKLVDAGLFRAYNYLMLVNEETAEEMTRWMEENPNELRRLVEWTRDNPYAAGDHPFSRLALESVEISAEEVGEAMNIEASLEE